MPFAGCRFAHASNVHLDATLRDVGPVPEELRETVRDATLTAFETLVTTCLDGALDFLLLAGGTFDTRDTSQRARAAFRDGVECLDEAGIPTIVVPGPHDPAGFWTRFERLPESVHVVDLHTEHPLHVRSDAGTLATIHTARTVASERHRRFDPSHSDPRPPRLLVTDRAVDPHGFDFVALTGEGPRSTAGEKPVLHHAGPLQSTHDDGQPGGTFTVVEVDERLRTRLHTRSAAVVRWERMQHALHHHDARQLDADRVAEDLVDRLGGLLDDEAAVQVVTWALTADPRAVTPRRRDLARRFDELWQDVGSGRVLHRWEIVPPQGLTADDDFTESVRERIRSEHVSAETVLADVSNTELYARLGRDLDASRVLARAESHVLVWLHEDTEGSRVA